MQTPRNHNTVPVLKELAIPRCHRYKTSPTKRDSKHHLEAHSTMADHSHGASASAATSHDTTSHTFDHTHHDTLSHFYSSHHDTSRHHETTPLKHSHHGHHHHHHHQHRNPSYPPPPYGTLPSDPENQAAQHSHYDHSQVSYRCRCPDCSYVGDQQHPCVVVFHALFVTLWLIVVMFIIVNAVRISRSRPSGPGPW